MWFRPAAEPGSPWLLLPDVPEPAKLSLPVLRERDCRLAMNVRGARPPGLSAVSQRRLRARSLAGSSLQVDGAHGASS